MKLIYLFLVICVSKISIILLLSFYDLDFFGGGNDSVYYNDYALGLIDEAVNIWPVLLRFLNQIGLYSRQGVSVALMFLGILVIPFLVARLSIVNKPIFSSRIFWIVALIVNLYPTLFFYTLDIYRDVFMVLIFLLGLIAVKNFVESKTFLNRCIMLPCILSGGAFLSLLRPYLGFSFFLAFLTYRLFSFRKWPFWTSLVIFLIAINILFSLGLFEPILKYRDIFSEGLEGGSNLGISFDGSTTFLLDFSKSFFDQIFGLHFSGISTLIAFFIESVPFTFFLVYLVKNRFYSNKFVDFLMVFFVTYSTIWLLGNDNLGTAVRLRIYSYLCVLISSVIVFQRKRNSLLH